jgi:sulfur carrier protein ThiS
LQHDPVVDARSRRCPAVAARGLRSRCLIASAVCVVLVAPRVKGQAAEHPTRPKLGPYLATLGIGPSQLAAAANGQAVVRLLKSDDNRDVAVSGVIAVRAPRDAVVAHALEGRAFISAEPIRFGVFSHPPTAADVRQAAFDNSEYKDLRKCRRADCDFKLSAAAMQSFMTGVEWSAPNAKAQADERLRTDLLQLLTDYQRHGNAAMLTYDDARVPARAADVFAALLAQSSHLSGYAPALFRYLETYPAERPAAVRDVLYWAEERLPHMRPTLTVNHVVAYAQPTGPAFVVRKQIYATHYFEGALQVLAVVDGGALAAPPSAAPMTYLVTVRRFRFDVLPGGILNVRGRVRSQLLDATRQDLVRTRAALQSMTAAEAASPTR